MSDEAIPSCEWVEEWDSSTWTPSCCDTVFQFNDGGAKDNGFTFCPYCGKPLVERRETLEEVRAETEEE